MMSFFENREISKKKKKKQFLVWIKIKSVLDTQPWQWFGVHYENTRLSKYTVFPYVLLAPAYNTHRIFAKDFVKKKRCSSV